MRQIAFLFLSTILMLQACKHHTSQNDPFADVPIVIDIDSIKVEDSLKLSHLQYLPLETTKECLIGNADKVLIRNNKIYVADFDKVMALFVFDMKGKFLFKIARRGNGPGEYISFNDFDLQTNGDIYMFDDFGKKFLIFDSTGEYLRDVKTDYYLSYFCLVDDNIYLSLLREHGKMFANLAVHRMKDNKTEFQLTDKRYLYDLDVMFKFNSYNFYYSPTNTYYSPKFSDIIYSINKKGTTPAIGIKNLLKLPSDVLEGLIQEKDPNKHLDFMMSNNQYFIQNIYIYETYKYIAIKCVTKMHNSSILLYNINSESTCAISPYNCFGIIGVDATSTIKGSTGDYFFSTIAFEPDNEIHQQILQSRKELANWKVDDNPVVVLFDFDM